MANLKEVRTRIVSVSSTQQITSAMKMVSASKLRRAQNAIIKLRPYSNKLNELLQNLSSEGADNDNVFFKHRQVNNVLIIAISSNRGLCGAFNSNVIKSTVSLINNKYSEQNLKGNVSLITFGKSVTEFFMKRKYNIEESHNDIFEKLTYENFLPIAEKILTSYKEGKWDKIEIIYNQFKNAAVQVLTNEEYLPVALKPHEVKSKTNVDYIYEPEKDIIFEELIPKSLKIQLFKALLDSHAAEHAARMTAMHKATDNANELIKELKLSYNKARQAAITKEILEIVSGAEALKS